MDPTILTIEKLGRSSNTKPPSSQANHFLEPWETKGPLDLIFSFQRPAKRHKTLGRSKESSKAIPNDPRKYVKNKNKEFEKYKNSVILTFFLVYENNPNCWALKNTLLGLGEFGICPGTQYTSNVECYGHIIVVYIWFYFKRNSNPLDPYLSMPSISLFNKTEILWGLHSLHQFPIFSSCGPVTWFLVYSESFKGLWALLKRPKKSETVAELVNKFDNGITPH